MKTKTAIFCGLAICLLLSVNHFSSKNTNGSSQSTPKTYCGMLGSQKVEFNGEYLGTKPDYEGTSPWEASNFKPNEDCSSRLNSLDVHTNIQNSKPTRPFSDKPFDIVLSYRPAQDALFLERHAKAIGEDSRNTLVNTNQNELVYETKKNENDYFVKTVIYLNEGRPSEIFKCGFNTSTKKDSCKIYYYWNSYNIVVFGKHKTVNDFVKVRHFVEGFFSSVSK